MLFRSAIFPLAADQQIPSTTRAKETIVLQKGRLYFKLFYLLQIAFEYTQSIVIKMRAEIPALNIIVSFLYISLAGASMFLLKLSSKPQHLPPSNQSLPRQQQSLKVYGRVAVSWLKKYSIIGAGMHADKKYLSKELLLLSVYGVACLKINKITLWPVALATFLLPSFFFMHEIAFKLQRNSQRATEKTCADELQIAVQSQNIEGTQVVSTHQQATNTRKAKQLKSTIEIVVISMIAFVAVVLDFQAAMVMAKSISNSGELNLVSVLCIVLLDQLILRPFSGLLFVAIIKFLEYKQIISIHQNKLIVFLCEQQLQEQQLLQERKRAKAALESTQNHLKQRQEEQHDTSVPIKPGNPHMAYIDFQHMQPEANQNVSSPHHAFSHSSKQVVDQQEVYITTPEKELFEADFFSNNHETIVNTYLRNKQNTENLSNTSQITYQPNHKKEVNCFEELILTKEHEQPLRSLQNLEPSFQNQAEAEEKRKKGENKRKNQRVLKLTGNSPYLQYLPNMLKKVRKAQTLGVPATPKLAQLNLR